MGLARVVLTATVGLSVCGCGLPSGEVIQYLVDSEELANASVSPEGVWESAPWSGPGVTWLPYPPQATIEVEHDLGRVPRAPTVWISFDERGEAPAPASGDLARLMAIDESVVSVRNSTNVELWARITLQ